MVVAYLSQKCRFDSRTPSFMILAPPLWVFAKFSDSSPSIKLAFQFAPDSRATGCQSATTVECHRCKIEMI